MKKINKTKYLLVVSFLAFAIISSPFVGLAKENKHDDNNYYNAKAKVEARGYAKNNNNSIWTRIFASFFGDRADAKDEDVSNDASAAPSISGVTAPTVLKVGQTGTWTVKASDPNNSSLSYSVDFGDTGISGLMARMWREQAFVQTSTFTHAYAKAGEYKVKFTVENEAGLKTNSTTTVHVSGKPATAPVISDVSAVSNSAHKAVITWKTDVKANSTVWFSTESPVDTSGNANVSQKEKTLDHKVKLTGLDAGTKYYVIIGSSNDAGKTLSSEVSFTTEGVKDKEAPVITSVDGTKEVNVGQEATITVKAYDPNNDSLTYSADWGDNFTILGMALLGHRMPAFVQTSTFSHVYDEAGTYNATFTVENSAGKKTSSTIEITVTDNTDTTAPVIAPHDNITIQATASAGAIVDYTAPQVTDNVDANAYATCSPASGSVFPIGNTTVLCNHTDASGNAAVQTSFIITVTPQ